MNATCETTYASTHRNATCETAYASTHRRLDSHNVKSLPDARANTPRFCDYVPCDTDTPTEARRSQSCTICLTSQTRKTPTGAQGSPTNQATCETM
eukprot:5512725-Alexandrium_andersonii.AAC.1